MPPQESPEQERHHDHLRGRPDRRSVLGSIETDRHQLHVYKARDGSIRWQLLSKEKSNLGLQDCTLPCFHMRSSGRSWRVSVGRVLARVVEKAVEPPPVASFSVNGIEISAELPELGKVVVEFVLCSRRACLAMRVKCPEIVAERPVNIQEFILFDGDTELGGRDARQGRSRWSRLGCLSIPLLWLMALCGLVWGTSMSGGSDSSLHLQSSAAAIAAASSKKALAVILCIVAALVVTLLLQLAISRLCRLRGPRRLFVNGWNAWSFTGAVQQGDRLHGPGMPAMFSAAFHHGAGMAPFERDKDVYSEMFALLAHNAQRTGIVMGFLSQNEQYGAFSLDPLLYEVGAHCRCDGQELRAGSSLTSDWCFIQLLTSLPDEPLGHYMDVAATVSCACVSRTGCAPVKTDITKVPVGWCSWYHFYDKITETSLEQNMGMMAEIRGQLPLDLFQIDDGYQRAWGDWTSLDREKFPSKTMPEMVRSIRAKGLRPGLWLAPIACDKHSLVAAEHPEWILRVSENGQPANSANCGKWFYALDITNPDVQAFVRDTLSTVSHGDWSFDYLKLDFLYVASLKAMRKDPTINTAQALQIAMRLIRESVGPQTFVLGCGAPLGGTIGWVNANRVSSDAGPAWYPTFPLPKCKWNLPCGRNMVRNTINRLQMHERWWVNDPDCMLLRESTAFTPAEIVGIATVKALSGGSFIISDDLGSLSRKRRQIAQALLPLTGKAAVALDLLDREMPEVLRLALNTPAAGEWVVAALCNWDDKVKDSWWAWEPLLRPLVPCASERSRHLSVHVLEFWSSTYRHMDVELQEDVKPRPMLPREREHLKALRIAPHSARLFALRVDQFNTPQYIGSDIHFSSGTELRRLEWTKQADGRVEVVVELDAGKTVDGKDHYVWLSLPGSSGVESLEMVPGALKVESDVDRVWKVPLPNQRARMFTWMLAYRSSAPCDAES